MEPSGNTSWSQHEKKKKKMAMSKNLVAQRMKKEIHKLKDYLNALEEQLDEESSRRKLLENAVVCVGAPMPDVDSQEDEYQLKQVELEVDWLQRELFALRRQLTKLELRSISTMREVEMLAHHQQHSGKKEAAASSRRNDELKRAMSSVVSELNYTYDFLDLEKAQNDELERMWRTDPYILMHIDNSLMRPPDTNALRKSLDKAAHTRGHKAPLLSDQILQLWEEEARNELESQSSTGSQGLQAYTPGHKSPAAGSPLHPLYATKLSKLTQAGHGGGAGGSLSFSPPHGGSPGSLSPGRDLILKKAKEQLQRSQHHPHSHHRRSMSDFSTENISPTSLAAAAAAEEKAAVYEDSSSRVRSVLISREMSVDTRSTEPSEFGSSEVSPTESEKSRGGGSLGRMRGEKGAAASALGSGVGVGGGGSGGFSMGLVRLREMRALAAKQKEEEKRKEREKREAERERGEGEEEVLGDTLIISAPAAEDEDLKGAQEPNAAGAAAAAGGAAAAGSNPMTRSDSNKARVEGGSALYGGSSRGSEGGDLDRLAATLSDASTHSHALGGTGEEQQHRVSRSPFDAYRAGGAKSALTSASTSRRSSLDLAPGEGQRGLPQSALSVSSSAAAAALSHAGRSTKTVLSGNARDEQEVRKGLRQCKDANALSEELVRCLASVYLTSQAKQRQLAAAAAAAAADNAARREGGASASSGVGPVSGSSGGGGGGSSTSSRMSTWVRSKTGLSPSSTNTPSLASTSPLVSPRDGAPGGGAASGGAVSSSGEGGAAAPLKRTVSVPAAISAFHDFIKSLPSPTSIGSSHADKHELSPRQGEGGASASPRGELATTPEGKPDEEKEAALGDDKWPQKELSDPYGVLREHPCPELGPYKEAQVISSVPAAGGGDLDDGHYASALANFGQELEHAKEEYLLAAIGIGNDDRLILPKLLEWYGVDFASSELAVLGWVAKQLPVLQKQAMQERMPRNKDLYVEVSPYDWTFRYLVHRSLATNALGSSEPQ
eukprot:jgi/Mesen1/8943/ME000553S08416